MKTAICIASGPSLTQADVDFCRGKGTIYVVNDCYKLAPWADVLYACDHQWWKHHEGVMSFAGRRCSIDEKAHIDFGTEKIGQQVDGIWSSDKSQITTGGNSGFQVLHLAVNEGHDRIILLGYDMGMGADGKRHWFGSHPGALDLDSEYHVWCKNFADAVPFIPAKVINCSRRTALDCFEKMELERAL